MEMQQDAKPVLEVWVLIQHFAVDIKSCQTDCFSEMVNNPLIP